MVISPFALFKIGIRPNRMGFEALDAARDCLPEKVYLPVKGGLTWRDQEEADALRQIPCIERAATASVEVINSARRALQGNPTHRVGPGQVFKTGSGTNVDMKTKYRASPGGRLARNIIEC